MEINKILVDNAEILEEIISYQSSCKNKNFPSAKYMTLGFLF